jgi:hypothetical protein
MAIPKIELTKKWWVTNRPKDVKGAELEKALAAVEQADDGRLVAALGAVSGAIAKAAKELDKKEDKDLLKALDSLDAMADTAKKKAEAEAKAAAQAKAKEEAKAKSEEQEKEKQSDDEEDDEHTPEDKFFEPAFQLTTLRRGLRAPIIFAFAMAGKPEQSLLAVHARGNSKNLLRIAKTRSGALKGCFGHAQAAEDDPKTLTLSLDCPLVGGLARAVRKYFQLNKITIFRKIRVVVDGKEAESDSGEEAAAPEAQAQAAAPPSAQAAAASARPAAKPAAPEEPSVPLTEQQMQELDDRRQEFKKARAAWVAVKNKAEMDLEKVKDGARTLYAADAAQFPRIAQGCKDIDSILDNLDDALRDTLDRYASTPLKQQAKLHELAGSAKEILDGYRSYVESNAVMKAIDQKEFADVAIHAPIMKALNDLRKTLS